MIHYIQPFDTNSPPNIGGAINAAIKQLNADPEDWIVNMDHDILWLGFDSKKQLADVLDNTTYHILGPRMNRLGNDYQLVKGAFDIVDIKHHMNIADLYHTMFYGQVTALRDGPLAAAVLCFQVKTWKALGGFNENSLAFDTQFCNRAHRIGMKLGIMEGIYVFHTYRLGKVVNNIDHLL